MAKKDYSKLEKDDLLKVIEKLESRKKYGLIWDEEKTKEQFEKESENALPVLKEVKGKEIKTDLAKPTNILIEGDNYHTLSVLNYTHQGKIDVIYIDPPYNTGNKDFKYNDRYVDREDSYRHSKWLSFITKRLRLAKSLLTDEGVIFVSIGDDELAQLKILCDEIFGEENLLSIVSRKSKATSNKGNFFSPSTDYILAYAKNYLLLSEFDDAVAQTTDKYLKLFKYKDKRGKYNIVSLYMPSLDPRPNQRYFITCPDGSKVITPEEDKMFRWIPATFEKNLKDDRVVFIKTKTSPLIDKKGNQAKWNIYTKIYLHERQKTGMKPLTFIDMPNSVGSKELIKMGIDFAFSKPRQLVEHLIRITDKKEDIFVLDFFAGSGTSGHAVLNLNNIDNGKRVFILCTNNEENICTDICYPRLQKAIKGYKAPKGEKIDGLGGNLKYFKTAFVKNSISQDDLKIRITRECTEMLCLREGIFDEKKAKSDYRIFEQSDRVMAVYYAFERDGLEQLKKELDKMKGEKVLYCFTLDPLGLDKNDFADWEGVSLEPIPQKILDIYEQIYEY
ncbi:MAG: site-specific DNA-methyltransferase [Candidatus Omnitrophota bacterium]|nr:site-specific DNA-methyltransferase [Candidatus Omnitrophota bacterium]